jgi:hypothetical protein
MSRTTKKHEELVDGKGLCSVPMWSMGCDAGFCDEPAFGYRPETKEIFRDPYTGRDIRWDGKYAGYIPGLACPGHGGPTAKEMAHFGDPCQFCGTPHDEVEIGPCPKKIEENKVAARKK